jgi:hypothetical protein
MPATGASRYRVGAAGCPPPVAQLRWTAIVRLPSQVGLLPKMIECSSRPNGVRSGAMRVALAAFLSIITTAATIGEETTAERIDAVEKRVGVLEAIIGPALASRGTSSPEAEEDKGQMLLKLTKWSASIKEGQYSTSYYVINYSLENNYDKPVKWINGSIKFFNPVGAQTLELKLERYARIGPRGEVSFKDF